MAPAGLSTDDEAGRENYHMQVKGYQTKHLTAPVERLHEVLFAASNVVIEAPEKWSLTWPPIKEQTAEEGADLASKVVAVMKQLVDLGVPLNALLDAMTANGEWRAAAPTWRPDGSSGDTAQLNGAQALAVLEVAVRVQLGELEADVGTEIVARVVGIEIEEARRSLSEATFKELYLAEPADDGSNPFGLANIERIIAPGLSNRPTVAWGWDLGKYVDFTFGVGLDEYGCVTQVWRWKDSWERTVDRIAALVGNTPALVDSTGAGDMPVERLQLRCGKLEGFKFSARSKQQLMEGLAIAIGNEELSVVEDHGLASELRNFEYEVTRTGVRYTAPPGYHDDGVMALALAEYRLRNKSTYIFDTAPRL